MAARAQTRHGASARAGKASSSATPKKTAARRAPARASRTPTSTAARAVAPRKAAAPKKKPGIPSILKRRTSHGVPVLPVAIVVAVILLGWFMYPIARMHYAEQRKLETLETQLTQVQKRNEKLKREVDRLKTPAGIESAAHELGLARKGEQVWVTVTTTATAADLSTGMPVSLRRAEMTPGIWTQVLDVVFGVGE